MKSRCFTTAACIETPENADSAVLHTSECCRRPSQLIFSIERSPTTRAALLNSLVTLYGLIALMLGVVIPISDALAKPVKHAAYRQVFYIAMLSAGIASVLYLSLMLSCYQRRRRRHLRRLREEAEAEEAEAEEAEAEAEAEAEQQHQQQQVVVFVTDDAGSPSAAVGDGEFDGEAATEAAADGGCGEYEESGPQLAADAPLTPRRRISANSHKPRRRSGRKRRLRDLLLLPTNADNCRNFTAQAHNSKPKILWTDGGVNLYLRLGAIVFGFGVMTHDGFKIAEALQDSRNCHGPLFMPKQVVHLLFIMCQTYYVFKYHRVCINTQHTAVRFMMVHLIATNLCIWVKTVVYEIKMGLIHSSVVNHGHGTADYPPINKSDAGSGLNNTHYCKSTHPEEAVSQKLAPYLYPCAVEYGLICAAVCFKFFRSVGDSASRPYGQSKQQTTPKFTTCHKSHKGLFAGLLIMMCVLVPLISLVFLRAGSGRRAYVLTVLCVECCVLLCTICMSAGGTVQMVRRLQFSRVRGSEAFEVNLLLVGLAGIVCYNLFIAIPVLTCLLDSQRVAHCSWGSGKEFYTTKLDGIKSLLEVLQSVVQTFFIMQGIQRKVSERLLQRLQKPGRGLTIALLIANLAMWVASVFEAKRNMSQEFLESYFGHMPWSIIKYICLPLIIFCELKVHAGD